MKSPLKLLMSAPVQYRLSPVPTQLTPATPSDCVAQPVGTALWQVATLDRSFGLMKLCAILSMLNGKVSRDSVGAAGR